MRKWTLWPLMVLLAIVPFITRTHVFEPNEMHKEIFVNSGLVTDIFVYYKSILISLVGAVMLTYIVVNLIRDKGVRSRLGKFKFIPIYLMILLVILSSLFSEYRLITFIGFPGRFETILVWLTYLITVPYAAIVISDSDDLKSIMQAFIISSSIMMFLGLLEHAGYALTMQPWFQKLITPKNVSVVYEQEKWVFTSVTFFNSNYMGSYIAMALPVTTAFLQMESDIKKRGALVMLIVAQLLVLISSRSSAGLVGAVVAMSVVLLGQSKKVLQADKKMTLGLIAIVAVVIGTTVVYSSENMFIDELNQLARKNSSYGGIHYESLEISDSEFSVGFNNYEIKTKLADGQFEFYDKDDRPISYLKTDGEYVFDAPYNIFTIAPLQQIKGLEITQGELKFYITVNVDGLSLLDRFGREIEVFEDIPSYGFEGYERLLSNRGYIWSRSIPLLADNMFIGAGSDIYPYEFPQNDYIGKMNVFGNYKIVVDKPHNFYLQSAVNHGVVFLLLMIVWIALMISKTVMKKFRVSSDLDGIQKSISIACVGAVLGYLVAGMFNDSIVGVSQIFWVLLGAMAIHVE